MAPPVHEMSPEQYATVKRLPCEEQVEKLTQILELYSNYIRDGRQAREALSVNIDAVIGGTLK